MLIDFFFFLVLLFRRKLFLIYNNHFERNVSTTIHWFFWTGFFVLILIKMFRPFYNPTSLKCLWYSLSFLKYSNRIIYSIPSDMLFPLPVIPSAFLKKCQFFPMAFSFPTLLIHIPGPSRRHKFATVDL